MTTVSVIVPVYNSAATLEELVRRLTAVGDGLTESYELVLVNDGSVDDSWTRIEALSQEYSHVRGINLMRNFGQQNALLAGIREARYDLVITMDDDLQNPPEEIPKLFSALGPRVDVVYGTPLRPRHTRRRHVSSFVAKLVLRKAMGSQTAGRVSSFRLFRTALRSAFDHYQGPYVSIDVLLTWGTERFATVGVQHNARAAGKSGYDFKKLVVHTLNLMTGFSTRPLRMASLVGFFFSLFGFGVLAYVVVVRLAHGTSIPGFAFLASIVAIFSGAQLFALGIIGEYVARMHLRLMDKPAYAAFGRTDDEKTRAHDARQART